MLINLAYAQDAVAATGGSASFLTQIAPLLPMVVIFYLFFIRPQRKRALEHKNLITNLKKGDQIVTNGGIIASVVKNVEKDPYIIAEIADSMRVRLTREAITGMFVNDNKKNSDDGAKSNKKQESKSKDEKASKPSKARKTKKAESAASAKSKNESKTDSKSDSEKKPSTDSEPQASVVNK